MAAKSKTTTTNTKPSAPKQAKVNVTPTGLPPEQRMFKAGFWSDHWLPMVILMAISFLIYAKSIGFGYILDDEMVIWKNTYVLKGFGGLREIFSGDSFMGYFQKQQFLLEGGRYRPLSLATFAIEVGLFGPEKPMFGHIFNIIFYGLTAIVLYRLLLGLFPIQSSRLWYASLAFFAAAFFVLHPLHSECVANIKGRDEILALLGSLFALYAALKYGDTGQKRWLALSGFSLFLAMLSKENALTFVAIIPITIWFFRSKDKTVGSSGITPITVVLFAVALLFILIRYRALGFMVGHGKAVTDLMNDPFLGMTGSERLATISLTLGWYIKLLFVPHPLTHDYYPYHVPKVNWSDWRALAGAGIHVAMGIWAVLNFRKGKLLAYLILFYVLTLSIVSNLFVSVGTFMNERFVFMPSVAFCILLAWLLTQKLPLLIKEQPGAFNILGAMLAATIGGLYAYGTITRVPDWETAFTLNKSAVQSSPNSARAQSFYVTALYQEKYLKIKDEKLQEPYVDTMEYHINKALEINPDYGAALIMKSAVAAARFEQDHQLDKFFHELTYIMEKIPYNTNFRNFLDQYMKRLEASNSDKYVPFCHRTGYDFYFKKKNDAKTAKVFLEYGLNRQTEDIRIFKALQEVYTALGETDKAAYMAAEAAKQ